MAELIRPTFAGFRSEGLRIVALVACVLTSVFISPFAYAERPIPQLSGPVVDEAGVLDRSSRERLEALARATRSESSGQGPQLQFLVVPTLGDEPIADYSIRVAEQWKIGSRGADNGVLFVLARDDRQVRIEVGGGLEGELTDAQAGRIIRGSMAPEFRAGRYGDGLYQGAVQVLSTLGALPEGVAQPRSTGPQPGADRPADGFKSMLMAVGLFALIVALAARSGRGRRGGPFGPSGWGGGLGGFGGFRSGGGNRRQGGPGNAGGRGGWGGGGGGFSGGGASGSW